MCGYWIAVKLMSKAKNGVAASGMLSRSMSVSIIMLIMRFSE